MESSSFSLVLSVLLLGIASVNGNGTRVGFYSDTCPRAEEIIKATVEKYFKTNPRIAPGLLRLHFHDCFVRGCDGSVLIDGESTEKSSFQNIGIPGYDVIDDAKAQLETVCPGVVSCADILAIAARDSVVFTKGFGWEVASGRRDGRVSTTSEAAKPRELMASHLKKFRALGLSPLDLVTLVGAHTIGTTSCGLVRTRLYNFSTPTGADPTIDPSFVQTLRTICPPTGDASVRVELDYGGGSHFDARFFSTVRSNRAVLDSDSLLWTDPVTKPIVERFLGLRSDRLNFKAEFAKSMVKLGNIGVKSGDDGEIRRICSSVNLY